MSLDVPLLRSSFQAVTPHWEALADRFYERLFSLHPEVRPLFGSPMENQKRHLIASLALIVKFLDDGDALTRYVQDLGRRHAIYGVQPEHYPIVGENLLAVLAEFAGPAWSPVLARAWGDAYEALQDLILEAISGAET